MTDWFVQRMENFDIIQHNCRYIFRRKSAKTYLFHCPYLFWGEVWVDARTKFTTKLKACLY